MCISEKPTLFISFSGGRTSAYMTDILLSKYHEKYDFIVTFANTGQEHDKTLEFINKCDQRWGGVVIWLEAVVNPQKGEGTRYSIVDFTTATRRHETHDETPFAQVIAKYGIPGMTAPQICTRELKGAVMGSYRRDVEKRTGTKCYNAIGIRSDEKKRLMKPVDREKFKVVYPLCDWFETEKGDVLDYWAEQEFDLEIPERLGNCVACWKKSLAKLTLIAKENPEYFDFAERMEANHPQTNNKVGYRDRVFFRGHRTAKDIKALGLGIDIVNVDDSTDDAGGCTESCEVTTAEMFDAGG